MRLSIALSKGELYQAAVSLLERAGFDAEPLAGLSPRQLTLAVDRDEIDYLICRPTDVPVYVEYGAADLGICGKDVLLEHGKNVYELVDLAFGACRFVLAEPEGRSETAESSYAHLGHARIATKYPHVTEEYFARKGLQVEVIKLHGNVELAPLVGLAEQIVDLSSTGRTLRENRLEVVDTIAECTARLIANPVAMKVKFDRVNEVAERIRAAID